MVFLRRNEGRGRPYRAAARAGLIAVALLLGGADNDIQNDPPDAENRAQGSQNPTSSIAPPAAIGAQHRETGEPTHEGDTEAAKKGFLGVSNEGWIAIFTAILTGATVALGWFTFNLWRATEKTIRHASDSSEKELRAYIAVAPMGVAQRIGRTDTIGQVDVRNIGKLPARNVSVIVRMETGTRERDQFSFDADNAEPRVLQPGDAMRQGSKKPYLRHTTITKAKDHVFVWGVVWYDDGYGERRFTRFCHRYSAASYNRDHDWGQKATSTLLILAADKARLHNHGNDAT